MEGSQAVPAAGQAASATKPQLSSKATAFSIAAIMASSRPPPSPPSPAPESPIPTEENKIQTVISPLGKISCYRCGFEK